MRGEYLPVGDHSSRKFFSVASTQLQHQPSIYPMNFKIMSQEQTCTNSFDKKFAILEQLNKKQGDNTNLKPDLGSKILVKATQTRSDRILPNFTETPQAPKDNLKESTLMISMQKTSQYLHMEEKKLRVKRTRIAFQMPLTETNSPLKQKIEIQARQGKSSPTGSIPVKAMQASHQRIGSLANFPVYMSQPAADPPVKNSSKMIRVKSRSMAHSEFTNLQLDSPRTVKPHFSEVSPAISGFGLKTGTSGFRVQHQITPTGSRSSSQSKLGSTHYLAFMKAKREECLKKREIGEVELLELRSNTKLNWDVERLPDSILDLQLGFKIGAGSFAQVYEAYDTLLLRNVAVKVFENLRVLNTAGRAHLLQQEISTMAKLPPHENVCRFFRVLQDKKKVASCSQ